MRPCTENAVKPVLKDHSKGWTGGLLTQTNYSEKLGVLITDRLKDRFDCR